MQKFDEKYFRTSWAMFTRDPGWWKPVFALAAATCIPIIGSLALLGYCLEWARLTAWGVDASPKQSKVDVGDCIKSGWRGFLVMFCWSLVAGFILGILNRIFRGLFGTANVFYSITSILTSLLSAIGMVAAIRAAIYQDIKAGFQINRIFEMINHDFVGLVKVYLISFVWTAITILLSLIVVIPSLFLNVASFERMQQVADYPGSITGGQVVQIFQVLGEFVLPILVILLPFFLLSFTAMQLVSGNALGLWMRQFNVPSWGRTDDPLPPSIIPSQPVQAAYYEEPANSYNPPNPPYNA